MDRIELIESLERELKEVTDKKAELVIEKEKAYKRTYSYFKEKFEPKDTTKLTGLVDMGLDSRYLTFSDMRSKYGNDSTNYSLNRVIDLGHSIRKTQEECEELQSKIDAYKSSSVDMIAFIKKAMEEE